MREDVFAEFILLKNNQSDSRPLTSKDHANMSRLSTYFEIAFRTIREHDVLFRWVDEQVPIASADAAIAVVHVA
jgi:hypothetical protein